MHFAKWFSSMRNLLEHLFIQGFRPEPLVNFVTELRDVAYSELPKHGVEVMDRPPELKGKQDKTKIFLRGATRLYPHESNRVKDGVPMYVFRFDDITSKLNGQRYEKFIEVTINSGKKAVESVTSTL